jgi:hypothetical protein
MTKNQVIGLLGNPETIIGSKLQDNKVLEIYQFNQNMGLAEPSKTLWFIFKDNELNEWGPASQYKTANYEPIYERNLKE